MPPKGWRNGMPSGDTILHRNTMQAASADALSRVQIEESEWEYEYDEEETEVGQLLIE